MKLNFFFIGFHNQRENKHQKASRSKLKNAEIGWGERYRETKKKIPNEGAFQISFFQIHKPFVGSIQAAHDPTLASKQTAIEVSFPSQPAGHVLGLTPYKKMGIINKKKKRKKKDLKQIERQNSAIYDKKITKLKQS